MAVPPALVGRPLSFHSDAAKYGYILYQGTKCEHAIPWGSICHDEVSCAPVAYAWAGLSVRAHYGMTIIDVLHQRRVQQQGGALTLRNLSLPICTQQ